MKQQKNQDKPMTDSELVGKRIKELRKKSGWNQAVAARQLLVSESVLCRIEKGDRDPTFPILKRICEVFHVSADYVIYGEKDTENQLDLNGLPFLKINAIKELTSGIRCNCQNCKKSC